MHDNKTHAPRMLELTGIFCRYDLTRILEKNQDHLQVATIVDVFDLNQVQIFIKVRPVLHSHAGHR